ncbi:MAG: hypothetical protein KF754_05455 [Planctomycetes bacterium]|nr:hypothetical protein [Planctomycetota bacterium]
MLALISLSPALASQANDSLASPTAIERETARAGMGDKALAIYRKALKDGAAPALLVDALMELGRKREGADIGLIARHVSSLDPHVSTAAVDALKGYGRAGLKAVQALDAATIDAQTRRQALDLLLLDHVKNCCRRDFSVNPLRLDYTARLDELYSVDLPLDDLLMKLLRDALPDIRQDIEGTRYYYYYGYQPVREQPFVEYGALAVAALARRRPESLEREMSELARVSNEDRGWYGYGNQRAPVTLELAAFFARRGQTALVDKLINDMQSMLRWQEGRYAVPFHLQLAALQSSALGEHSAALDRINAALKSVGLEPDQGVGYAHYLRARILLHLQEEGEALHALEDAMEASNSPPVLVMVDNAFDKLRTERRFRDVQRFCELREKLLPPQSRPWRKGEPEPEPEPEPEQPEPVEDDD